MNLRYSRKDLTQYFFNHYEVELGTVERLSQSRNQRNIQIKVTFKFEIQY